MIVNNPTEHYVPLWDLTRGVGEGILKSFEGVNFGLFQCSVSIVFLWLAGI